MENTVKKIKEEPIVLCKRSDCFSCHEGKCVALEDNHFDGACPFFKTKEEAAEGFKKSAIRAIEIGKYNEAIKNLKMLTRWCADGNQ